MNVRGIALALVAVAAVTVARLAGSVPEGIPMILLPQGVSHVVIDGERIFLVREGSVVRAFLGRSTARDGEPIVWCPDQRAFVAPTDTSLWTMRGEWVAGPAERDLDQVAVEVDLNLAVHVDPGEVTRAEGRSRGTIGGAAGEQYARFRAGDAAADFCWNPVPPVSPAVPPAPSP